MPMNLSLRQKDPRNTVLVLPDGQAMYRVHTPKNRYLFAGRMTTIERANAKVGRIEWPAFGDAQLWVGQYLVQPRKIRAFSSTKVFQAQDNQIYKWKVKSGRPTLLHDDSNTPIAVYHKDKSCVFEGSHPGSLEVTLRGTHILDDIVTTFLWYQYTSPDSEETSPLPSPNFAASA